MDCHAASWRGSKDSAMNSLLASGWDSSNDNCSLYILNWTSPSVDCSLPNLHYNFNIMKCSLLILHYTLWIKYQDVAARFIGPTGLINRQAAEKKSRAIADPAPQSHSALLYHDFAVQPFVLSHSEFRNPKSKFQRLPALDFRFFYPQSKIQIPKTPDYSL